MPNIKVKGNGLNIEIEVDGKTYRGGWQSSDSPKFDEWSINGTVFQTSPVNDEAGLKAVAQKFLASIGENGEDIGEIIYDRFLNSAQMTTVAASIEEKFKSGKIRLVQTAPPCIPHALDRDIRLSENETAVLLEAEYIHRKPEQGTRWSGGYTGWFTPQEVGGSNRSHHSYTLGKLVKKGLIETEQRNSLSGIRGSRVYRITEKGLRFVEMRQLLENATASEASS